MHLAETFAGEKNWPEAEKALENALKLNPRFVDDTGGKLFFNRNDVDAEMKQSQQLGSEYYTLTYQPQDVGQDGKFRHIRVTLRDPKLRVVTKAGYYAPDEKAPANRRESTLSDLAEAVRSSVPFQALEVNIADTVRHPDAETAELTLRVSAKNLNWQAEDDGKDHAVITLIAASMSGDGDILASKLSRWRFSSQLQDPGQLAKAFLQIPITVRVPKRTTVIRVAVAGEAQGRIGTAEIARKSYEAAPALPSPTPQLVSPQPGAHVAGRQSGPLRVFSISIPIQIGVPPVPRPWGPGIALMLGTPTPNTP